MRQRKKYCTGNQRKKVKKKKNYEYKRIKNGKKE